MLKMTWTSRTLRIELSMNTLTNTWDVRTFDIETGRLYRHNSRTFNTEGEALRYADWLITA